MLVQEKDEWKISFRDQLNTYSYLWISQLLQGKTKDALLQLSGDERKLSLILWNLSMAQSQVHHHQKSR